MIEFALTRRYESARITGAFVYGQGSFASYVQSFLKILQIPFLGFLDYRSSSMDPRLLSTSATGESQQIVFLGFHNYAADESKICNQLLSDGYLIINVVELAKILQAENILLENYWLTNRFDIYRAELESIQHAASLFQETKSQNLYHDVIEYRKTGNFELLKLKDDLSNQYFPNDLPWLTSLQEIISGVSVLDGGAYQGETFLHARKLVSIKNWVFIEPDPHNFDILTKATSQTFEKKIFLETALHSTKMALKFSSAENTFGSYLSANGDLKVITSTIDEIYDNGKIDLDLIKLDVEGNELAALTGGQMTINTRKPFLAISIYHKPEDHWEIPLFISKNFPFYDFYLRLHGEQTFDLVLYCIPQR